MNRYFASSTTNTNKGADASAAKQHAAIVIRETRVGITGACSTAGLTEMPATIEWYQIAFGNRVAATPADAPHLAARLILDTGRSGAARL